MKLKCSVQVTSMRKIKEMPNGWSNQDYLHILEQFGFKGQMADSVTKELAMRALSNQESQISAQMLLNYKLKQRLSEDQIQQISKEMHERRLSEIYPDIFIQQDLFNINQLLHDSFKGLFPTGKAVELVMTLMVSPILYMKDEHWINEIILKSLLPKFENHSPLLKLYEADINSSKRFTIASGILWKTEISKSMDGCFDIRLYSSEYWLGSLRKSPIYDTTIDVLAINEIG